MTTPAELIACQDALCETGRMFHQRGWSLGTSSNYSVVLQQQPLQLLVTASGKHKGRLTRNDFVQVGTDGKPLYEDQPKSSAETLLHVAIAQETTAGAILHTHSVWATVLSEQFFSEGAIKITDYEMLKGLDNVTTHQHLEHLSIFDNTQDIAQLATDLRDRFQQQPEQLAHGFLIRQHGLYTWGETLDDAQRQIEVFEFLLECIGRRGHS
jgi:methylthioribulose-1-phosphate dehydratase